MSAPPESRQRGTEPPSPVSSGAVSIQQTASGTSASAASARRIAYSRRRRFVREDGRMGSRVGPSANAVVSGASTGHVDGVIQSDEPGVALTAPRHGDLLN